MKHPWNRLVNSAVRRKRYGRKNLDFPLTGKKLNDTELLIKYCEPNAKQMYDRMDKEFKDIVKHTIAEVPMTAEEAIVAVKNHARLNV